MCIIYIFCLHLVHTECSNENGGCSHICVLSSEQEYSCLCPEHLQIDRDGRTCSRKSK